MVIASEREQEKMKSNCLMYRTLTLHQEKNSGDG
jgi:hypothetical protein